MSKHILNSLRFSGGILSIYCLSLAIVPMASAAETNMSQGTGAQTASFNQSQGTAAQTASFNSFAASSASASAAGKGGTGGEGGTGGTGGTGGEGGAGEKSNPRFSSNRQANIRAAQGLQARLDAAQSSYDSASARVAQLLASSSTPATTPDNPKLSPVRFALKPMNSTEAGECGCNNPDVATVKPADNSAEVARELAVAKEAQAKAAQELADAQAQARQFLESAKSPQVAQNTTFSPVW
jgi:hypothetical protein